MSASLSTSELRTTWRQRFRGRSYLLAFAASFWILIILVRLFQIMVIDRDELRQKYHTTSWRQGTLPAVRGRILDAGGLPIAWSVRSFTLYYEPAADVGQLRRDIETLTARLNTPLEPVLTRIQAAAGADSVLLFTQLTAPQMVTIQRLRNPRLKIVSTFTRQHRALPASVQAALGKTRVYGQVEVGISGWEEKYDRQLRGKDGHFLVMVDKAGDWIPETWVEVSPPSPGLDVYVGANNSP